MSKESMKVIMLIVSAVYDLLVSRVCYGQKLNLDMENAKEAQQQQKQQQRGVRKGIDFVITDLWL